MVRCDDAWTFSIVFMCYHFIRKSSEMRSSSLISYQIDWKFKQNPITFTYLLLFLIEISFLHSHGLWHTYTWSKKKKSYSIEFKTKKKWKNKSIYILNLGIGFVCFPSARRLLNILTFSWFFIFWISKTISLTFVHFSLWIKYT